MKRPRPARRALLAIACLIPIIAVAAWQVLPPGRETLTTVTVTRGNIENSVTALGTLQASVGQLVEGGVADLCVFDPQAAWTVQADALRSQGKHTPFSGYELPGSVRATVVGGQVAFEREPG